MSKFGNRRLSVFLCHASKDQAIARDLYRRLKTENWLDVWFVEISLMPSQDWDFEIRRALKHSDALIVLYSKNSIEKERASYPNIVFVLDTLRGQPQGSNLGIILRLDNEQVPESLTTWEAMDYFLKSQRKFAYQKLLKKLKPRAEQLGISTIGQNFTPEPEEAIQWFPPTWEQTASADFDNDKKSAPPENSQADSHQASEGKFSSAMHISPLMRIITAILLAFSFFGLAVNYLVRIPKSTPAPTSAPDTPTPIPEIGSIQVSLIDSMKMVFVPAGEFLMGGDVYFDEKPVHPVRLYAFWIDQTEVTNSMYAAFLNEQRNHEEDGVTWLDAADNDVRIHFGDNSWHADPGYEYHPVVEVTWYGANAYCLWADRRLPTEAQWEKAARGKDGFVYPWGNNDPTAELLNFDHNIGDTTAAGSYPNGASPYGALDMAGNVWEWVADRHSRTYYSTSPLLNPTGPDTGFFRVLRGGAWNYRDTYARSVHRNRGVPIISHDFIGFRCARSE